MKDKPLRNASGTSDFVSDEEMNRKVESNKYIYDEYFDMEWVRSLERNVIRHINENYFRARFIGFEKLPERNNPDRPLIFFGNHSGMAFPWDAIMFSASLSKLADTNHSKSARALVAPPLNRFRLMNAFLLRNFWQRGGGVDATTLNFETMMQYKETNLLIYPEGVGGIGKGFNKRYQLQRFATSFVRMSIKYKTDVIPVCTVNGEYINPYTFSFKWLNKQVAKIGIPFLPVGVVIFLLPIFPWLFYFAFPARLTYLLGERIKPYEMTDKPFEDLSRQDLEEITDKIRAKMQLQLDEGVEKYGKHPYKGWQLFLKNLRYFSKIPYFNSPFWPFLFSEHDRLYNKYKGSGKEANLKLSFFSIFKVILLNLSALIFFIPVLGWIPIIWRGYHK